MLCDAIEASKHGTMQTDAVEAPEPMSMLTDAIEAPKPMSMLTDAANGIDAIEASPAKRCRFRHRCCASPVQGN